MAKRNGGIIGPANTPTSSVAAGVWRLRDAFNSIKNGTWPLTRSVATNSLRFNSGSTDYLNKTFSTSGTSAYIATISLWIKKAKLGSSQFIFGTFAGSPSVYSNDLYFTSSDTLEFDFGNAAQYALVTTQVFRDVGAWYHIVIAIDSTQATAANRVKMYVNGSQITAFGTANYPAQNSVLMAFKNSNANSIGAAWNAGGPIDAYMSEFINVDGQQLTPSSFGASNASGVWYPIAYQGTYGTNGFNLKFANSASLGTDSSGNANNFTVNNLTSVDQSTDTELNNFATLNALCAGSGLSLTEGNLKASYSSADAYKTTPATFGATKGKWYWEHKIGSDLTYQLFGITTENNIFDARNTDIMTGYKTSYCWLAYATQARYNTTGGAYSSITYGTSLTGGDIVGCALDLDNNKIWWSKNGTWQNSGDPVAGTGQAFDIVSSSSLGYAYFPFVIVLDTGLTGIEINFGSPSYSANGYTDGAGYGNFSYAVPSGYYALCTKNLNTYG